MAWQTLVQAEDLAQALGREGLVIVDCRFSIANPTAGEQAYAQGHLPGAVYAHLDRDLSDMRRVGKGEGQGRHPWPQAAEFTARLGSWGITPQHQVVAYDDADGGQAGRLWFLLRALGHADVAVLDGGFARWQSLGLPVTNEVPRPAPVRYEGEFDRARLLDADQVRARLASGDLLIDARGADRFRGENETIDPIAGHVPGAVSRPFVTNLESGRFKPGARLAEEFTALLEGRPVEDAMVMCGSGVTACHHLLAMEHAGLRGAKLFTGSWSGWIEDASRPVARGES